MANAKNAVIAGDFIGGTISSSFGRVIITGRDYLSIYLDKESVEFYEVITDEHRKSAASGVARGLVGGVLLGPVGMLAGGLSAKAKGIYQVAILFKSDDPKLLTCGKRSLIEIDDKLYKLLVRNCF